MRGHGLRRSLCLTAVLVASGCTTGPSDPPDCAAAANGPWHVGRGPNPIEVAVGESVRESVTPGLFECGSSLISVTWTAADPAIAAIDPLGPRNPANNTAGDIARAWITGLAPGVTLVKAVVRFNDGARDAEPRAVRVLAAAAPPPGSFVVAEGSASVTFNQFTDAGGSELIPVALPRSGRIDVSVDWTSFENRMVSSLWEGSCAASPCPGRLVIESQLGLTKPHRETAEDLAAGEYTLRVGGLGKGQDTARYEIRLTPN